jgi:hypothetical protein
MVEGKEMKALPTELRYLEPALQELAKIPSEALDEDANVSSLDAALRQRVKGLKLREATSRLTQDRDILKEWLKKNGATDAPAHWIAGYLMRPGPLARGLLAPPPRAEPTVEMDAPHGWRSRSRPRQLTVEKAGLFAEFTVEDESGYSWAQIQAEAREKDRGDAQCRMQWFRSTVQFGKTSGFKYVLNQSGRVNWKAIEYLLEVPGGFIRASVGRTDGKEFDETVIESKLHTLRVIPPSPEDSKGA